MLSLRPTGSHKRWFAVKNVSILNPISLFAVAAIAFVGWVIYDAFQPSKRPALEVISDDASPVPVRGVASIKGLEMLRPGMFRPEVEERLQSVFGMVPADVGAVERGGDFPIYRVRYRQSSIQPIAQKPLFTAQSVTVTYDARSIGHPLVGISVVPDENGGITRTTAS